MKIVETRIDLLSLQEVVLELASLRCRDILYANKGTESVRRGRTLGHLL